MYEGFEYERVRERIDSSSFFFFVRERARGDEDKVGNKR